MVMVKLVVEIDSKYHWFVGVLLELNKSNSHHIVDVQVCVQSVDFIVTVQERCDGGRCNMHSLFTVHFLRNDVVAL